VLWVSIYIKNHCPAEVLARFSALPSGSVAMSVITYGELAFGAEKSAKSLAAQQILPQLTALIPVLPLDENASLLTARLANTCKCWARLSATMTCGFPPTRWLKT
jgi:predicted nucleic acid-binding protein